MELAVADSFTCALQGQRSGNWRSRERQRKLGIIRVEPHLLLKCYMCPGWKSEEKRDRSSKDHL